ncbi:hypothetical protein [Streptomyces hesseae]|uniref:Barstar (barnase inhibitor) domain-containing protein n=1 Tax=Streptomyces hesseae TaxID=3075519 RepID=A0ABU2SH64_9ACTN|nr:hypothetical protein [Streptomyces sp. DSM 40473]MDT0448128.1 hypothetical protein [Streptomyces sp. DSM 40473]
MPIENDSPSAAKHWQECTGVHDFLEQVRLLPGMWLPGGSLQTLESMLVGYRVALGVHAVDEPFDFWNGGKFSQWLDDCLGDVACLGPYDGSPEGAGLVLVLTDYDRFAAACPEAAHAVLDLIAGQARRASVFQRRVICLVHSNDPGIRFDPVGAMPVLWNDKEWLDAARR